MINLGVYHSLLSIPRILLVGLLALLTWSYPAQAGVFDRVPLSFERNQGQTAPNYRYFARGETSTLYLACSEAVLRLGSDQRQPNSEMPSDGVLRLGFGDAENPCRTEGVDRRPGKSNYFGGDSPNRSITGVPSYSKVRYSDVYPGIDLVFYGNQRQFEYDFVVAPSGDPQKIRLTIDGADYLEIDSAGRLVAQVGNEKVIQDRPFVYQPSEQAQDTIVEGAWVLLGQNDVGFELGAYDRERPLIIDPVIVYSTLLNGSMVSKGSDISVDEQGFVYVVGETSSPDFPVTGGAIQTDYGQTVRNAFVAKLNPAGDQVVFATYLGGRAIDSAFGVDTDPQGNVYVTGFTGTQGFPLTPGAFDTERAGATGFIAKLSPDGSQLLYSTFIGDGGGGFEAGNAIAVDAEGFAYVAGTTTSSAFPVVNAVQSQESSALPEAFILKINQAGSALVFATYWGGGDDRETAESIALDEQGAVYVAGTTRSSDFPTTPGAYQTSFAGVSDAFLLKLAPGGAQVVYSTLIGGDNRDEGRGVAVDLLGNAYVVGDTSSRATFPVTMGAWKENPGNVEGFVAKFSRLGDALDYSTFVGGRDNETLTNIALDTAGHAYVTGFTNVLATIETINAIPGTQGDGPRMNSAALFAKLRTDGSGASVFLGFGGGSSSDRGNAIAVDGNCHAHLTGEALSKDFLAVNAIQPTTLASPGSADAFITKIDPSVETTEPVIGCSGVVQATGTPVVREGASNSIMTVFGKNFATPGTQALVPELDGAGRIATVLANTCVEVNGVRSPMFAVFPGQINFQNPHGTAPGYAAYRVVRGCGTANEEFSEPEHIRIRPATPAFFNFVNNADGANPIAALHQDGAAFVGPARLRTALTN